MSQMNGNPVDAPTPLELGQRIEARMKERGMRPETLASDADVSISKLRRWFKGDGEPSYLEMLRVASRLDRPLLWFATGIEEGREDDTTGKLLDADIRQLLMSQKQQRLRELQEIDALLGI